MREHYTIKLTSNMAETKGQPVTLFIDHMRAFWPQKDGTCIIETTGGEFHVTESEETIFSKASGHGVITRVGLS